jgi:hypothetical protein
VIEGDNVVSGRQGLTCRHTYIPSGRRDATRNVGHGKKSSEVVLAVVWNNKFEGVAAWPFMMLVEDVLELLYVESWLHRYPFVIWMIVFWASGP